MTFSRPAAGSLLLCAVLLLGGCIGEEGAADAGDAVSGSAPTAGRQASAGEGSADTALQRLAAELVPELERRSGLEARETPRLARRSRAELEAFLDEELAEQMPPEKVEALGATYSRLGLLPDTLELGGLLRRLYMEQVVGYYDPAADTLFVLEDVEPSEARTVLVHELVHALQDQHVDLDSLTASLRERNDASSAARAAIEGQATLVMAEWVLKQSTGSDADLTEMPGIAEKFGRVAAQGAPESMPTFAAAPRIVRETLTFPYVGGLGYIQDLWSRSEGRPPPFGPRLPSSTEQVLHPERGPGATPDAPTEVSLGASPDGWEEQYANSLGELETRIFLSVHLDADSAARTAAVGWDGDRVRLLRSEGREALLWVTVWDAPGEADEFADAARRAFGARYAGSDGRTVSVEHRDVTGRPVVRILDRPSDVSAGVLEPSLRLEPAGDGDAGRPSPDERP